MKKRAIPNRSYRIADQIQRDLAELIPRELKDPRIGFVTISGVQVSPDYAHAKVYFTVLMGDPKDSETALNESAGYLRNWLFKRLRLHTVPTLHFHFDQTTERAAEMNALISRVTAEPAAGADASSQGNPVEPRPDPDEPEDDNTGRS